MNELSFRDLIRRVRSGDEYAAHELARRYEPAIRREARLRLTAPDMRRWMDSDDVCQSVLASFFVRAANGGYELAEPRQLIRLLGRMAHHKVVDRVREQRCQRRHHDGGAPQTLDGGQVERLTDGGQGPYEHVQMADMQAAVRDRLSPAERQLSDFRVRGMTWKEIAKRLDTEADRLRKRLNRALDRVAVELGIDEI